MKQKTRVILCSLVTVLAAWLLSPTIWELVTFQTNKELIPGWMPKTPMRLGLDLQGGIHMVLGVDLNKVHVNELGRIKRSLEQQIKDDSLTALVVLNEKKFELEITSEDPAHRQKISDLIYGPFNALQFVGAQGNTIVARLSPDHQAYIDQQAIDQSIATVRNRIDEFGVAEPLISKLGESQILVQFPGADDPQRLKSLIGQTAQLMFQIVHECANEDSGCLARMNSEWEMKIAAAEEKGGFKKEDFKTFSEYRTRLIEQLKPELPPDTTLAFEKIADTTVAGKEILKPFILSTKDQISGEYIQDARVTMDRAQGALSGERPVVSFEMSPVGAPLFGELTGKNVGRFMAIVLDGMVKSAPTLKDRITNNGQISLGTGTYDETLKEANDTAIVLRAGALPTDIQIDEERMIGPSMGRDAVRAGRTSLVVAVVVVFAFMIIYYGAGGLVASLATLINIASVFAILGLVGATLTLPGIAGLVLTVGMAVDAFIIIFERMRDEIRLGRSPRQVVEYGFDQAARTILDANITTAIGAYILLSFGSGSIRGFAVTLLVGICANVFFATFFTKTIYNWMVKTNYDRVRVGIDPNTLATQQR